MRADQDSGAFPAHIAKAAGLSGRQRVERAPEFLPDAGDLNLTANLGSRRRMTQGASQKREARSDYPIAQRPTPPRRSISEGCSWKRALVFWRESAEGAEAVRTRDRGDRTAVPRARAKLVAREVEPQRPQRGHLRRIAEAAKRPVATPAR
jgi:hypothetical protein